MRTGRQHRVAGLLTAALLLLPALGAARNPDLDEGRRLFQQVEYEKAVAALKRALQGALAREERIEATLLLAKAYRGLDRPGDVRAALRELLKIDPGYRLSPDREPPSLIAVLERVREEMRRPEPPAPARIEHVPVRVGYAGLGVTLKATIANLRPEHRARVHYRRIGQLRYETVNLARREGDHFVATIPGTSLAPQATDYLVEYYLSVTDALGEVVARAGSEERPFTLRVVAPARPAAPVPALDQAPSWHRRYFWVWLAVGVVVVGGAVGAGLAAR
jgi:tetratricopeptide (TPR) repeat protein